MNKKTQAKTLLLHDAFWYFLGASIPMLVMFIRSPIYTRIFTPEEYGYYTLVNITFTYISSISFAWIANCSWRYYLNYKKRDLTMVFNRIIGFMFIVSSVIILLVTIIWVFVAGNPLLKKLIYYGFLFFLSNELINILLIPLRIEGKARNYNLIHSSRIVISFALLLMLTFYGNLRIEAFFLAGAYINLACLIYIFLTKIFRIDLKFILLKRKELQPFLNYGFSSLGINICLFFLISADRYILAIYKEIDLVGIYNQVYNIAQITLVALFNIYHAAINPITLEKLEARAADSVQTLSNFAYRSVFMFLPFALLFSLFAKGIAYILLGKEFREAYYILPYIIAGAFLYGMNYFTTLKFKFENRMALLISGAFIATLMNIGLNFIFIPKYGILAAAITTTISYLFLWLFYYLKSDVNYLSDKQNKKKYLVLFFTLLFVTGIYIAVSCFLNYDKSSLLTSLLFATGLLVVYAILTIRINPFLNLLKKKTDD